MPREIKINKKLVDEYGLFWFFLYLTWVVLFSDCGMPGIWAWPSALVATTLSHFLFAMNQKELETPLNMGKVTLWTMVIFMLIGLSSCISAGNRTLEVSTPDDDYRRAIQGLQNVADKKKAYCDAHPTAC